jgi:hypothetical protein
MNYHKLQLYAAALPIVCVLYRYGRQSAAHTHKYYGYNKPSASLIIMIIIYAEKTKKKLSRNFFSNRNYDDDAIGASYNSSQHVRIEEINKWLLATVGGGIEKKKKQTK